MSERGEMRDDVLYHVAADDPAVGPRVLCGWLIRKACVRGAITPATQADVDAWDPGWPPLEFTDRETFADGTRPILPPRRPQEPPR